MAQRWDLAAPPMGVVSVCADKAKLFASELLFRHWSPVSDMAQVVRIVR